MSENLKLRLDHATGETQQDRLSRAIDPGGAIDGGPIDEAESQMRKALGLLGEGQRQRPDSDRMEQSGRIGERFNGGLHRRRFVQDGDIPVTVLRRDQGHEAPANRGIAPANLPTNSRLQRTEAALAAETAAREKAERSLAETHALARDLQTKIGHAELAKNEALEALRQEREASVQFRSDLVQWEDRLNEALGKARSAERTSETLQAQLDEERQARIVAERALQVAISARESAEQLALAISEARRDEEASRISESKQLAETSHADAKPSARRAKPARKVRGEVEKPRVEPEVASANARRPRTAVVPAAEPEPVKWWLNTKPAVKRR